MGVLHAVGWLFSGVFLVNAIPHLVHGVSGDTFPSPFAKPYGKRRAGAIGNVVWAFTNIVFFATVLYFNYRSFSGVNGAIMIIGGCAMGVFLAHYFSNKEPE